MITPMTGLIALLIIALIGWVVAELKDKCVTFVHSEEEAEGEEEMKEAYEAHGGRELNLRTCLHITVRTATSLSKINSK